MAQISVGDREPITISEKVPLKGFELPLTSLAAISGAFSRSITLKTHPLVPVSRGDYLSNTCSNQLSTQQPPDPSLGPLGLFRHLGHG